MLLLELNPDRLAMRVASSEVSADAEDNADAKHRFMIYTDTTIAVYDITISEETKCLSVKEVYATAVTNKKLRVVSQRSGFINKMIEVSDREDTN